MKRYESAAAMRYELEDLEEVRLTGRWERLKAPSPWKNGSRKGIWIGIGVAIAVAVFVLVVLLIMHRGAAT